jgi:mono/diheme cytochrome c family protein
LLALSGCRQDMHDQPRFETLEKSAFFGDARSARRQVTGTVAQGQLHEDEHLYAGLAGGEPAKTFPFAVTRAVIDRGRERFDIFCSPCHGRVGDGNGMIAQRGFRHPPTYHQQRLYEEPVGHFFDVISNGFGAMYSFNDRIPPRDRWAIVAYIRALQLSQAAKVEELPADVREQFERAVSQ